MTIHAEGREWIRLEERNQWGRFEYWLPDSLQPLNQPLSVLVRWPTGDIQRCKVVCHVVHNWTCEQGAGPEMVTTARWMVVFPANGMMHTVPIVELDVCFGPDDETD